MKRREFISWGAATSLAVTGCRSVPDTTHIQGGFINNDLVERGHALRDRQEELNKPPIVTHKTHVLIAGGGVAGLAAARALRLQGIDDFVLLELQDKAGGNSQGTRVGGLPCPQGAHYLPLPSNDAPEVQDLLEELGLRQRVSGRWQYDERYLCHSPQERLFLNRQWQEGLLPLQGVGLGTIEQYRRFSGLVDELRKAERWTIPLQNTAAKPIQRALAAITFVVWLNQQKLTDGYLRWYLDYCCRDDYGAGIDTVSAWAGIHYFASRHGFYAPSVDMPEREGLLTWPEGNAWLTQRMAAPLGERLRTGQTVLRISTHKHHAEVDVFNTATRAVERWQAERVIVALPIFMAERVIDTPPDFLRQAAMRVVYAPWVVANIHIAKPLNDRSGAPLSWDNVIYDSYSGQGLGYVDARHQSLSPVLGATVLTHYRATNDRWETLATEWSAWRDRILSELSAPHPDLIAKATRIDITRYGHAMAIPAPHPEGKIGLHPFHRLGVVHERLSFAHSDWAGYSIFEEAFTMGHKAASSLRNSLN